MKKFNVNVSKELARNVIYYVGGMAILLYCTVFTQAFVGTSYTEWIVDVHKTVLRFSVSLPLTIVGLFYFLHILGYFTINGKEFNDEL